MFIFDNKKVSTKNPNYIGVDLSNDLIVITNGNPYMKGLMDVHKCAYLPSGHNNSDIDSESSTIARVRRNLVEISNWNHALIMFGISKHLLSLKFSRFLECSLHGAS